MSGINSAIFRSRYYERYQLDYLVTGLIMSDIHKIITGDGSGLT